MSFPLNRLHQTEARQDTALLFATLMACVLVDLQQQAVVTHGAQNTDDAR